MVFDTIADNHTGCMHLLHLKLLKKHPVVEAEMSI